MPLFVRQQVGEEVLRMRQDTVAEAQVEGRSKAC